MNVFHKVTLTALKKNKTRTIATIIGIILSAAMICAVTTSFATLRGFLIDFTVYNQGDWHGSAESTDKATLDELQSSDKIEKTAYSKYVGYAIAEGCTNSDKPYLHIIGTSDNFKDMMPIHMIEGRYPTAPGEILIPAHLSTNGGVTYKLGDTLTLDVGDRMIDGAMLNQSNPYINNEATGEVESLEVRETVTYKVVGFYARAGFEDYYAPGYTAITVSEESGDGIYDVYFKMNSAGDYYDFVKDQKFSGHTNADLLMYSGVIQYPEFMIVFYGLAAVIIALILFGSISLIYNAFSISVSERTKQFGLLSSIGATKKQIRKTVFFEAFVVSAIGIPLGVLAGIGGMGVTFHFVSELFVKMGMPEELPIRLCVTWISIVAAIIIALVTVFISAWVPSIRATRVTVIDAIRQSKDVKIGKKDTKTSKLTYRLFGLPGVIATKHFKRNRKKYRTTVVSLFMSIVLFVSATSIVSYVQDVTELGYGTAGYDIIYYGDSLPDGYDAEKLFEEMSGSAGVTDGAYYRRHISRLFANRKDITEDYLTNCVDGYSDPELAAEGKVSFVATVVFVQDDLYRKLLSENGLDEAKYMNTEKPLALAYNHYSAYSDTKEKFVSGNVLAAENASLSFECEKTPDGYYVYEVFTDENGRMMCSLEKYADADDKYTIPYDEIYSMKELVVGAFIKEAPFYVGDSEELRLIYPNSLASTVVGDFEEKLSVIFKFTSDDHTKSFEEMKEILKNNNLSTGELSDYAAAVEDTRNLMTIVNIFAYGFIILISLIAATNVFNTISTSIALRRREFAMLKSVGMTEKDFNKMMNFECILYGAKSLVLGLPTSCVISFIIYKLISNAMDISFRLPWFAMGIATLSVFLVVFATMLYAMHKIKKENPIDALKNENL